MLQIPNERAEYTGFLQELRFQICRLRGDHVMEQFQDGVTKFEFT